jgi:hypothetical protein
MREPRTVVVVLAVIAGYAAVATTVPSLTWTATALVLLPATIVMVLAVRRHRSADGRAEPVVRRSVWIWSLLILAGLLWEAWAFVHQPGVTVASYQHPSLSSLVGPWLHAWPVRYAAWAGWLFIGWRLVGR